jgi:RimK-like ATP-grasp domain
VILLCGIPSEPPVRLALEAARALGVEHRLLSQRLAASADVTLSIRDGRVEGRLWLAGEEIDLSRVDGIYLRLMDADLLPESRRPQAFDPDGPERAAAVGRLLADWCEVTPGRVANRISAMSSNSSKPYQAQLIAACGLPVPETLVTNDLSAVRDFARRAGRLVYKSTSSQRSIVRELDLDRADLNRVRHLPTQFQALVPGLNVRVHVVGDAVLACAIRSATVDYRYAGAEGAEMEPIELPSDVEDRCIRVSRELDLPFCGIDLILDDSGVWWCLEANPSPAYSAFEEPTGLPIAEALVRWLHTGSAVPDRAVA